LGSIKTTCSPDAIPVAWCVVPPACCAPLDAAVKQMKKEKIKKLKLGMPGERLPNNG